jgi:hypothetical protein
MLTYDNIFSKNQLFQFNSWLIPTSLKYDLQSDDPFVFSKACRQLSELFDNQDMFPQQHSDDKIDDVDECIDDDGSDYVNNNEMKSDGNNSIIPTTLIDIRILYVIKSMKILLGVYFKSYAIQPIDSLFTTISSKRLKISNITYREMLDNIVTEKTQSSRKRQSGAKQHNIRTFNSTSHPISQKNDSILR